MAAPKKATKSAKPVVASGKPPVKVAQKSTKVVNVPGKTKEQFPT